MSSSQPTSTLSIEFRVILLAGVVAALASAAPAATVAVNAGITTRTTPVDERVFGLNAVMWDGQTSSAQTISMLQAAGVRAIRVPGGSASDTYHWNVNKSDTNALPLALNSWTWGAGFDSFTRLLTGINAQAFITVNYGSGTPQEAAAWVAYANASSTLLGTGADVAIGVDANNVDWKTAGYWSALRAAAPLGSDDGSNFLRISRAAPFALRYWEIGNECYGSWEEDLHAAKWDPVTYATVAKNYLLAMKAVDPSIKIGVVSETGEDNLDSQSPVHNVTNPRTGVAHHGWTPVMLATLKTISATPDFLIYHRYDGAPGQETDVALLQVAKTWPSDAANLRQMITDYLGAAGIELCVTENNSVYTNPGKQSTSLVNGLYLADSIGNVLQTEINSLVWWDLRNGPPTDTQGHLIGNQSSSLYGWRQFGDYGVLSTPTTVSGETTYYDPYPTYYVMKLLSNFARNGDTVVKATSDDPLLAVFAVKHTDGSLRLLVINKSPTATLTANTTLTGFAPRATATVYSYGMPQDNAAHAGTGSTDVASSSQAIAGTAFALQFAPYSATVVVLDDANQVQVINAISYNSTTFPATALPGAAITFTCNVTNQGTNTWGPNHYLVLRDANDGNLAFASLSGIGPGVSTTASLTLTAPTTPGQYTYYVQGLENNVAYFATRQALSLAVGSSAADFNGDGKADVIWSNTATGDRAIWYLNGTAIDSFGYVAGIPTEWHIVGSADFNNDGHPDLVWEDVATGDRTFWLMNGVSIDSFGYLAFVDPVWHIAAIGDFNSDGKSDVIWENTATGDRAVWYLNGMAIDSFGYIAGIPTDWHIVGAADFDGDGQTDLVWENLVTGDRTVWFMNGTAILSFGYIANIPGDWHIAMVADFNGDGKPDLLWENTTTGDRAIWLMDGTSQTSAPYFAYVDPVWRIAP